MNPSSDAAPFVIPNKWVFGYQILPRVGFQLGRTYRNRIPFAAIEQTPFVRRFYFGADLNFDVTRYTRLSLTDILYIRGEKPNSRGYNYFKGMLALPVPALWDRSGQSFLLPLSADNNRPFQHQRSMRLLLDFVFKQMVGLGSFVKNYRKSEKQT